MKHIYDIIESEKLDTTNEYRRLYYKYSGETPFHSPSGHRISLEENAKDYIFQNIPIKIKKSSVNLSDFLQRIKLNLSQYNVVSYHHSLDDLFYFMEYIDLLHFYDDVMDRDWEDSYNSIYGNINYILEETSHHFINGKLGRIIVPKDALVEEAAEDFTEKNPEAALLLLNYNHRSNQGNLKAKQNILLTLAPSIEPLLKGQNQGNTADSVSYMLNWFNIRHNNKEGKKVNPEFNALTDKEKEEWYDKLYHSIVALIIEKEQKTINLEVKNFREK